MPAVVSTVSNGIYYFYCCREIRILDIHSCVSLAKKQRDVGGTGISLKMCVITQHISVISLFMSWGVGLI